MPITHQLGKIRKNQHSELLEKGRMFWDINPCDGHSEIKERLKFRYRKEPWLKPILEKIATYSNILEVGCGQGTDSLFICAHMKSSGRYIGIDASGKSVEKAVLSAEFCKDDLMVKPVYNIGNSEQLDVPSDSIECVYSMGVFHHTPDTKKAVDEVYRVLVPGGTAYIFLYRTQAPKVFVAHILRLFSKVFDMLTLQDRFLWRILCRFGSNHMLGTMFHECFGVPILKSYTKGKIRQLFSKFKEIEIAPVGMGLPYVGINRLIDSAPSNLFGTLWKIVLIK